jgi:hypothetical protein
MKKLLNLASNLRALFGVARLLTLIAGIGWLYVFLISLAPRTAPTMALPYANVALRTSTAPIVMKSPTSIVGDISVTRLTTELQLNPHSTDRDLAAAIRWTLLPHTILGFIVTWLSLGLLQNLCARVEQGEVFSETNLRSIRNLGLILVSWSLADGAMQSWSAYRLGGFLSRHVSVTGINATLATDATTIVRLSFESLITGLLVLLLAEAFRQGLALKKENELTV